MTLIRDICSISSSCTTEYEVESHTELSHHIDERVGGDEEIRFKGRKVGHAHEDVDHVLRGEQQRAYQRGAHERVRQRVDGARQQAKLAVKQDAGEEEEEKRDRSADQMKDVHDGFNNSILWLFAIGLLLHDLKALKQKENER